MHTHTTRNPPPQKKTQAEVKAWEDSGALAGGPDGTDVIQAILQASPQLLRPRADGGLGRVRDDVSVLYSILLRRVVAFGCSCSFTCPLAHHRDRGIYAFYTCLQVWMEVDVSHPELFKQEGQTAASNGMRLVEWRRDMAGNPRFCCWEAEAGAAS